MTGTSQLRHRGVAVQLRFAAPLVSLLLRQLGVDAIDGLILEEA